MERKTIRIKAWWVLLAFVLVGGLFLLNAGIRERVRWKISEVYSEVFYALKPPEEAIFIPQEAEKQLTSTPSITAAATTMVATTKPGEPTHTPFPTKLPTLTPTELPDSVVLEGVTYTHQHGKWNYCAPANLTMALSYWDVVITRDEAAAYLKPEDEDRNVKPYEMANFVNDQTDLGVAVRSGGDLGVLRRLVAAGYPVLIEKGLYMPRTPGSIQILWMGHYNLIVGYDAEKEIFITHDSYLSPPEYELFLPISYEDLISQWRSFNYIFMVVYPIEDQATIFSLLGNYADATWAQQHASEIALDEMETLTGEDLFFAKFNYGNSLRLLFDYGPAAVAFDDAFAVYAELDPNRRPWRMMWYQTGPYYAYFYTGRYQDVIDLATTTIDSSSKPYIEESWYWRAQAKLALGDTEGAIADFEESLKYHPGFQPSLEALALLGYVP